MNVKQSAVMSLPGIEVNAAADVRIERVTDAHSCVVIDDFLKDPQSVVAFAIENADAFSVPADSYPGLLFDVAEESMAEINRYVRSEMSRRFSFLRGGIKTAAYLSMATLQPDELSNLQRLCHTDPRERPDRRNYAGLVYLFEDEALGGTGFYRWKEQKLIEEATALELEDPKRASAFLQEHFATYRQPARYMTESNEIAELCLEIPARFNRFIFYSGDLPHSASISAPELLTEDFSRGRLTLNCFVSVRAR
ncbi:MAG: DUF6445 family protein [Gammaproteobacteria bacterium]|nr:DUF6445 family protein [Gammaproteobacteria bacterium]MDH3428383.1 DUF6445 family protein [Gammaproteobacteria bacterium]